MVNETEIENILKKRASIIAYKIDKFSKAGIEPDQASKFAEVEYNNILHQRIKETGVVYGKGYFINSIKNPDHCLNLIPYLNILIPNADMRVSALNTVFMHVINKKEIGEKIKIGKKLIDAGVNINQFFFKTIYQGETELIEPILNCGVDINLKFKTCGSALHLAASYGHLGVAEVLIKRGIEYRPDDKGKYPLFYAQEYATRNPGEKGEELVKLLRKYHAQVIAFKFVETLLDNGIKHALRSV